MESKYVIQIVDKHSGMVVKSWAPGLDVEKQFVDEIVDRVFGKQVGVFTSKKKVQQRVKEVVEEMLFELKSQV